MSCPRRALDILPWEDWFWGGKLSETREAEAELAGSSRVCSREAIPCAVSHNPHNSANRLSFDSASCPESGTTRRAWCCWP